MTSKEQKKKAIKIYRIFNGMVEKGIGKMEAYKKLAVRYKKSLSGIRYIVLVGKDYTDRQPDRYQKNILSNPRPER